MPLNKNCEKQFRRNYRYMYVVMFMHKQLIEQSHKISYDERIDT